MNQVLVAVVGMSPAVLTETVWALAQERPAVIPDKVVVITTTAGRQKIKEQLFGKDAVWNELRSALGDKARNKLEFCLEESIRVVGDDEDEYTDIITPEQNERTADVILEVLRQYTESEELQVIASIAGGRKSMSALMLSCMSLLGRESDRVCHVLTDEKYIRENPGFFYPRSAAEKKRASVQLSDIPFVCIKKWQNLKYAPESYSGLVRWVNTGEFDFPCIWINSETRDVGLEDENRHVHMGHTVFGLFYYWVRWLEKEPSASRRTWPDYREHLESYFAQHPIDTFASSWSQAFENKYFLEKDGHMVFDIDDHNLKGRMSDARTVLKELFRFPQMAETLVPDLSAKRTASFPVKNIRWIE